MHHIPSIIDAELDVMRVMLAHFLEDEKLNAQEIEVLKSLFDENGSDNQQEKRDT